MARKPTKTIDVNGLKIADILKMNVDDFRGVSTKNVKQITSRLVSAMNKRIVRLGKSEIGKLSPTYKAFEKRGKYSVKGLTRESTKTLFNILKESFSKKTSLTQWKQFRNETLEELDLTFLKDDIDLEKKFWDLYHKYEDESDILKNVKDVSNAVLNYFKKRLERNPNARIGTSKETIRNRINKLYAEMMNEKSKSGETPSIPKRFEDNGNY